MIARTLSLLALVALASASAEPRMAPPETGETEMLFNGKDLAGWDGDPRLWSVKDGAIRGETTTANPARGNTFLIWTGGTAKDFELRLSFRCNAANNSGIQYRSKRLDAKPDAANRWRVRGYQHEIRNQRKLPNVSGFLYDEGGKRGRMCLAGEKAVWGADGRKEVLENLVTAAEFAELFRLDQWNEVVIVAKGNQVRHYLNGRLVLDFTDTPELALTEGILAFQLHAGKPMWVEFRDIRIKHLK